MSGHKENAPSKKLENLRTIGIGWAGLALLFSWGLTLPVLLAVGSHGLIERQKKGGFFNMAKEIFPGNKGANKSHH